MPYRIARLAVFAVLVSIAPGPLAAAWADQNDPRLPDLFDRLMKAPSSDEAAEIDGKIWEIWVKAGNPALDTLMINGTDAMENGDYPTALEDFDRIIDKKPDFAEGWNKRATLYYLMGEYEKSLADIDTTLKLEPRHFGALSGMGLVDVKLEKYEDAAKAYQRVLAIDPRNAGAKANLEAINEIIKKKSI
jgi:tetratricopeptide (TPR) repeat protein